MCVLCALICVTIFLGRLWRVNFLLEWLYFLTLLPFLLSSKYRLHLDTEGELHKNVCVHTQSVCMC